MVVKRKFKNKDEDLENYDEDDITGSDDELSDSERRLLEKVRKKRVQENIDSDDEVYGLQSGKNDDNDDDEEADEEDHYDSMESDMDGPQQDDDLPNERAWGKKKTAYYSTDFVDPDYDTMSHKKMQAAELEEQEARNIQQRLAKQLDDADFGLDLIEPQVESDDEAPDEKVVKVDWSNMSKRKRAEYFHKENPEFEKVVSDVKKYLKEANEILSPFLNLVDKTEINHPSINFIKIKYRLVLNYSVNVSFYLMLKAKKIPVSSHPVLIKIAQYRKLLTQLEENQGEILEKVSEILKLGQKGELLETIFGDPEPDCEDDDAVMDDMSDSSKVNEEESEQEPELELSKEQKRAITTQMAKNKGLTPHRKKELRNPRVKHRNKYRKAQIRRKGAVRSVRTELKRYDGEISGIKASVKKGIKLK